MIEFTGHVDAAQSPEVTFGLLADMALLSRWNPNVVRSEIVSGTPLVAGARFESVIGRGPFRMTARSELVAVELGRHVEYAGAIAKFWSVDSLTFEPEGEGCRVTFRNETTAPPQLRIVIPLLNMAFQPQARKALAGAAAYLDSQ
ncbi:MAG: hypothetical protein HKN91_00050 [Acidimicrobiia bacterium]|nr:hypothetical protein [Acidimicrobiia bacterium]